MNDLLKPTLSSEDSGRALYSSRALFFTAFFGGPMAIVLLSALAIFLFHVIVVPEGTYGLKWLAEYRRTTPVFKYGPRVMGLIFWSIAFAIHRKYYKAMALMEVTPLNPWGSAIICVVIGGIIQIGILCSVLFLRGAL